jgi:hypothetical protein
VTDLLAIVGSSEQDDDLLDEVTRKHPHRVTVLVEDEASSSRMARLRRVIEQRTGAVIVGIVRDRSQLKGWRFDKIVGGATFGALLTLPLAG